MKLNFKKTSIASLAFAALLAGCAGMHPQPGATEAEVRAQLGRPTDVYRAGDDTLLEYAQGPVGQFTWMARIGPDGKLISYQQVLTEQRFGEIKVGKSTRDDVLRLVGRPSETSGLPLQGLDLWSYRYIREGVWDSLLSVGFDKQGVVRLVQDGMDPEHEGPGTIGH
jgi:hypothetical protein